MEFRIADTFTGSLARLTGEEQRAVKTTAFDLQLDPANPGMNFHRIERAKDKNFWSVRVNSDIRLIVHRTPGSLLLCFVDHHDRAYDWAERRRLETHPKTGAAQLVELRETVQEIWVPAPSNAPLPRVPRPLFAQVSDDELLGYGVPAEWLADVRQAAEDTILALLEHLPAEAAESLLELATGSKPVSRRVPIGGSDPFAHPDAQRRFRIMSDVEELQRALDFPWDKWTVFLHPEQRQWVERDYSGPARVTGSAGTGKTIVALHRAVFLARSHPEARVLLATFSGALANALRVRLHRLVSNQPRLAERIDVYALDALGARLYQSRFGPALLVSDETLTGLLREASAHADPHNFSLRFLRDEWEQVVDAWQLDSWEAYRDVARLGRKTRLPEAQRGLLWSLFAQVRTGLTAQELLTPSGLFARLTPALAQQANPPFDFAVVDEAQDLSIAQLRFLAALGTRHPDALFFAGDLGQRIFQQPFSWRTLGVDVRGRSRTLHVNYRTSHQIRMQADRLLDSAVTDADGNTDERSGTVSVFNGPPPLVQIFDAVAQESKAVSDWLTSRRAAGVAPQEIGVFVRSAAQLDRARTAMQSAALPFKVLDERAETEDGSASIGTMHLAKGLEYRAVAVMACDDEVIPLQERIENVVDDSDLEEVYNTERHLLYVACTRARDYLLVTGVTPASEFLDDLRAP